jgi:hypothetical protein
MPQRKGPTDAQLDAAIEGAKDMPEVSKRASKLVESATDPSQETGGPRGSGYPVSSTSGGFINSDSAHPVEPDEAIKRETAVFKPGTQRKDDSRRNG